MTPNKRGRKTQMANEERDAASAQIEPKSWRKGREGENNKEKFSSRVEAGKSSDWLISDMGSDGLVGLRLSICGRSHTEDS